MIKKPLFWETILMFVIMGALNYVALVYHLYWSLNEYDSVVHFSGGAAFSFFFLWFYFHSGFFNPQKRTLSQFLVVSIFGTMFISLGWEIFELFLGEASMNKALYPFDTMMDLIMDFLGAVAVCFYGYLREIKCKS